MRGSDVGIREDPASPYKRAWLWFLARFRLSKEAVCIMSAGRPEDDDFHDYPDDIHGHPWHFHRHTCKRCGKRFTI